MYYTCIYIYIYIYVHILKQYMLYYSRFKFQVSSLILRDFRGAGVIFKPEPIYDKVESKIIVNVTALKD